MDSSNEKPLSDQYLEESKDVDRYQLSYDDDDDDELVCREKTEEEEEDEFDKISKPVIRVESLVNGSESKSLENKPGRVAAAADAGDLTAINCNKYGLFEEYLSFLQTEKDENGEVKMHNPVLLGYWCNLFRSLVQTHAQEVFIYVYEHQELLNKMVDHLYSPQMSDIFVRLLNFNQSVFIKKD